MKTIWPLPLIASIVLLSQPVTLRAAAYTKASITQIYHDVKVLEPAVVRPARVNDTVAGKQSVKTGIQSRAELIFDDQSMTRLGANTIFSFQEGSRELELQQGTILFQVPKRAGGANIRTAAVTAAITGTTGFYEYSPKAAKGGIIKFGIVEGGATLFIKGRLGHSMHIGPGEMLICSASLRDFNSTEVVHFNISKFIKSCALINKMGGLNPAVAELVRREIAKQDRLMEKTGELSPTDIFFPGPGTLVLDLIHDAIPPTGTSPRTVIASPEPYVITSGTEIDTRVGADPSIRTNGTTDPGRNYRNSPADPPLGFLLFGSFLPFDSKVLPLPNPLDNTAAFEFSNLQLTGGPLFTTDGSARSVILGSDGVITSGAPGGIFKLDAVDYLSLLTVNGSITLGPELKFSCFRTVAPASVNNLALVMYARGPGSDLILGSDVDFADRSVNLFAGRKVEVNGSISKSSVGKILLRSDATSGVAIHVTNTAALRSFLNSAQPGPGGHIELRSSGGDINVAGTLDVAGKGGEAYIRNLGDSGTINLAGGHNIRADIVKAGVLGDNGVLNIGGGVIDAATELKLFAGGTNGTINFVGDTSLNGNSLKSIAARTVNVNSGVSLLINGGAATIFTDVPHYNGAGITAGPGFGSVFGTAPVTTAPHASRPAFP